MKISLMYVNVSYKRVSSIQFSELVLCLLFFKNNPPKTMLKTLILGWQILLAFKAIRLRCLYRLGSLNKHMKT